MVAEYTIFSSISIAFIKINTTTDSMCIKGKIIEYYEQILCKLGRFFERQKLSNLSQETIGNVKEIKFIVQNICLKKTTDPDGFISRFHQSFKKE